jgi:two-component system, LuxR family, sensor kinase FixL
MGDHHECSKELLHRLQIYLGMQDQRRPEMLQTQAGFCNHYADLYHFAPVGYLTLDPQGRILELNLIAATLMGENYSEMMGKPFSNWVAQKDLAVFLSFLETACGSTAKAVQELQLQRRDGKAIYGHLESLALRDPIDGALNCRVILLDVSTRVQMQAQLQQHREELFQLAQLNLLNELGAGLAHEINQPLTAIATYAQECARRLRIEPIKDDSSLLGVMEEVIAQAERASSIVRRLRQLVSRELRQPQRIQLGAIVHSAMELIKPRLKYKGISTSLEVSDNLPPIFMEPCQLEQVLLNLFCNAMDAMANNSANARRELAVVAVLNTAREVEVRVSDTGPGLTIEQLEQIFEPFFTTKPGRLGLGLTLSRSLITNYGGRLWFTPYATQGATFHFTLPSMDDSE